MPIQIACPRCRQMLLIAEDSGGHSAKCPGCLTEFVIPGGSRPPVAQAVMMAEPAAGTVTVTDVERARLLAERSAAEHLPAHIQLVEANRRWQRLSRKLSTLKLFQSGRQTLDHSVGRIGGFCLAVTIGGAVLVLLTNLFSASALGYLIAALVGILIAGAVYMPFSFLPDDPTLAAAMVRMGSKLEAASLARDQCVAAEAGLQAKLSAAQAEYGRLKAAFESRLNWLRTCQWQLMTGATFETFLGEVFKEHGYLVEATAKTGDQGVDLIVTRDGARVAVQAKGYVGHTVGNEAVQQVHAGKGFYGCQSAVVVTNSLYTPSARDLAERLDCHLIDGSQIPDLIEGRILV